MAPPVQAGENSKALIPDEVAAACLYAAGFNSTEVPVMLAIGIAESSRDTTAVGRAVPARPDYGYWQINYIHNGVAGMPANFFPPGAQWKSPVMNARAARVIYKMQGYRAWTVYKSGAYLKHLPAATTAARNAAGLTAPQAQSLLDKNLAILGFGVGTALGAIGLNPGGSTNLDFDENGNVNTDFESPVLDFASDPLGFLGKQYGPLLWIGGGSLLVVLGLVLMVKTSIPLNPVSAVKKVIK